MNTTILKVMPLLCIVFCLLNTNTYSRTEHHKPTQANTIPVASWVSSQSYAMGEIVSYENKVFRALHWTQGDTPRGFGIYPDGPWVYEGLCY
jgi:chitodextrinase